MADEIEAARARMIAKRFGGAENVRTGGKGSVRRKRKAQHKASSTGALESMCCGAANALTPISHANANAHPAPMYKYVSQPTADDKKMNATLKKLGVTNIPGIEEANMFKDNGEVIHFKNPKGKG